jgi:predicted amidohydrolase YtcJ
MKINLIKSCCFFITLSIYFAVQAEVTIIHNVNGKSINQYQLSNINAMAFEYGRIISLDSKEQLLKDYPDATIIDGQGQYMLPGLHDAQADMMQAALMSERLDLTTSKSIDEIISKIKIYNEQHPKLQWIEGYGWDEKNWDKIHGKTPVPNSHDFDELKINKPIWLKHRNGYAGWANAKAMEITFANNYKSNPTAGTIIFDEEGNHTGIYMGRALTIIQPHIPALRPEKKLMAMHNQLKKLTAFGITSIDDTGIDFRTFVVYKGLARNKKLPLRVNAILSSVEKNIEDVLENGPYHEENQFLHMHAIKYYVDGEFETHGAALFKPYADKQESTGTIRQPLHLLKEKIYPITIDGWQVSIHAAGDKASHIALQALNNDLTRSNPLRHRIEDISLISNDDMNIIINHKLPITIQANPSIINLAMIKKRIGTKRSASLNQWKKMIKNGVRFLSGSGYPRYTANPFVNMYALLTQIEDSNSNHEQIMQQILATYTINPAFANRQESALGSLEIGKWADFILVDQDIFTIKTKDISNTKVLQTWIAGKKVYDINNES